MSSSLLSPVEAVADLVFHPVPKSGRPIACTKVVRVDKTFIWVGSDGKLYSNSLHNCSAYMPGKWPWNDSLMRALVALGAITEEHMKQHLAACERAARRSQARDLLDWVPKRLAELGVDLTDEQLQALATIAERSEP